MSASKVIIVSLIVLVTLASCSHARRSARAELAQQAETDLVGLTKVNLLTCAGVPERSTTEGGLEFLSYRSGSGWSGSCVVTFVLKDDVVESINYSGRTGRRSQSGEQCAYTVANCLPEPASTSQ
jgi:hypothetical protein